MTGGQLERRCEVAWARSDDWMQLPIPAFLVEHPGAGPILVDTGFHPSVAVDPKQNLGPLIGRLYRIEMSPSRRSRRSCAAKGIEPSDIRVAIMTHLHMDHASAISDFTEATYVLGEGEWAAFHVARALR